MDVHSFALNPLVQIVAIYALPVLFAITLHEAAHGYVARHFGDMTAYAQGRISLNPLRHIDLVGTILVPIAILVASKLAGGAGYLNRRLQARRIDGGPDDPAPPTDL